MRIILLSGYRRTGKDAFFQRIINGKLINHSRYRVYKQSNNPNLMSLLYSSLMIKRVAFADKLKEEVNLSGDKEDIRHIYVNYAREKKKEDINYFCKKVDFSEINTTYIVTDNRYEHEIDYIKNICDSVYTIRLYREIVDRPNPDDDSEISLDHYKCDYLLIGENDNFDQVVNYLPQYRDYKFDEFF